MRRVNGGTLALVVLFLAVAPTAATANELFMLTDPALPGLSAAVEFTLLNPTTLEVRLRNTSMGAPSAFGNADQLLTGVSWDFGHPEYNGDAMITGGTVVIGPASASVNFDTGSYGPRFDVSGEYGYGNMDGTGALTNFISANTPQATSFGGLNLDGPQALDGPQGGLVANPILIDLGGLGAIQDEIIATLILSDPISEADLARDLAQNLVRVEFGSDAAFITTPEPASVLLLAAAACGTMRQRRR